MKQIGALLMALGVAFGTLIGLGLILGVTLPGLPWLIALGLTKLGLLASCGLIAAGAVVQRLAHRHEERERLESIASSERR